MTNPSGLDPTEFNVIVQLDEQKEKTDGGVWLPPTKQDRDELEMDEGTLVAVSPVAFTYENWPEDARRPQSGDRVLFARYSGVLHERGGKKFRIIKDRSIIAVVTPTPIRAVA